MIFKFQVVRGVTSTRAGTLFIPQSAGAAIGRLGCGMIMRATGRYRLLNIFIQLLHLASCALILGTFRTEVIAAAPFIYLLMEGIAYGSMLTITLIALISAVDHKYQAVITSASYAFRSTGSSIGITVASAVFQNVLKWRLFDRFGRLPGAVDEIRRIRDSVEEVRHLPEGWYDGVIAAYVEALNGVWSVVLGFAVLAALVSLFIREHILYKTLERR